jgi:hypothetical protein
MCGIEDLTKDRTAQQVTAREVIKFTYKTPVIYSLQRESSK